MGAVRTDLLKESVPGSDDKRKAADKEAEHKGEETSPKCDLIGTHAARRTFICFALSSGIPPQVVMKWTGHSDYQAMKLFEQEMEE